MGTLKDVGISALSSGANSFASNLASIPFNVLYSHLSEQQQYRMMNYQNRLNLSNLQYATGLNSPQMQMQRIKNAGLNPALMYGNLGQGMSSSVAPASLGNTGSRHSAYSTSVSPAEISQVRNINADTEKKKEETIRLKTENLYAEDNIIADLENKKADLVVKLSQKGLNDQMKEHYGKSIEELDARIKESKSRRDKIAQDIKESEERTKNYSYERAGMSATTAKIKEETRQLKDNAEVIKQGLVANVELADSQKEYYLWLADKAELEGNMIEKELESYNINLYSRLAKMTSEELRGWFRSVEKYNERMDEARKNGEISKNYKRFLIIRYILPLLIKK